MIEVMIKASSSLVEQNRNYLPQKQEKMFHHDELPIDMLNLSSLSLVIKWYDPHKW